MSAKLLNVYAPSPVMKRGAPFFSSFDAKSGNLVYAVGNAVVIRNVANPLSSDMYYEHTCQPTVAKYAPSGFYIASGDVQGNVRIWDTTQKEHPLKLEIRVLSGAVSDIAWSGDSQRVVAVGEGKERFGAVFVWDAGSSVGEISGHTKAIISCDFKAQRPFRVATGADDSQVNWFEGPPFKFKRSIRDHQRMVTCVRFSGDGSRMVTCATDKKLALYESKEGAKVAETPEAHKGGVYGVSWAPDGSRVASCSADKSVAIWDGASLKEVARVTLGGDKSGTEHQQLGCLWCTSDVLLSFNLEGEISYLDPSKLTAGPTRVLHGHNKAITSLVCGGGKFIYSGSYDGKIIKWDASNAENWTFVGQGHTNQVNQLTLAMNGTALASCGMDNTVRCTPLSSLAYAAPVASTEMPVVGVAAGNKGDMLVAVSDGAITVVVGGRPTATPIKFAPSCVSLSPDDREIAVGGKDADKSVHLYEVGANGSLRETGTLTEGIRGALVAVAYSPDGKWLATTDTSRNIFVWDRATKKIKIEGWIFHTARVSSIAWTPDSLHLASGGLDSSIYVWSVASPDKRVSFKNAHPSGVNVVSWLTPDVLVSAGQDCAIKSWAITF